MAELKATVSPQLGASQLAETGQLTQSYCLSPSQASAITLGVFCVLTGDWKLIIFNPQSGPASTWRGKEEGKKNKSSRSWRKVWLFDTGGREIYREGDWKKKEKKKRETDKEVGRVGLRVTRKV